MKIISLFSLLLLFSCSQFNTESKSYYDQKMRHGIVPLAREIPKDEKEPIKVNMAKAKRGKKVYEANCMSCHGPKGLGSEEKGGPRNLVKAVQSVQHFKFFIMVSKWQGEMPGWKSPLTDNDVENVKEYIKLLAKNAQ